MKTKNSIPAVFKIVSFIFLMTLTAACDKNFVNPADLSNNVDAEFSAEAASIKLGEGTSIHWSISDPDGAVETVNFSGGGEDEVVPLTGSKNVSPTESTVYYVTVANADGDILKSTQTKVQVLDENGLEIVNGSESAVPEVETLCADGLDDDEDGLFDCLDITDCAADVACVVEEAVPDASFTTEPTYTYTGDTICIGDTILVTWTSDFDGVSVSDSSGGEKYFTGEAATTGTYTIDALEETITTVTLVGSKNYADSESKTVTITTSDDALCNPEFAGRFSSGVYPSSTLIKGEAYALQWSSSDVVYVILDGDHVALEQSVADSALYSANSTTHSFEVWDNQYPSLSATRSNTVTANSFTAATQASLAAGVSKVIPGEDAATAYIISGTKIIKATEYLSVFADVLDTSTLSLAESTVTGYAVTSNGKTFVSTTNYVYLIDGTTAKKIVDFKDFYSDFTFNFVHAVGENVIVGSSKNLLKLDTAGDCDDGDGDDKDNDGEKINDVCVLQLGLNGDVIGGKTSIDETGDYKQVFKKYGRSSTSDTVFMITADGVFKSTNGGAGFSTTAVSDVNDVQGGSWLGSGGGFIWTNSAVYDYQGTSGFVVVDGLTGSMTGGAIYYVNYYGGRLFVATANGIYIKNSVGWSAAPVLSSAVPFLTFQNTVYKSSGSFTAGDFQIPIISLGGTEYTAVLLTNTGSTATVAYKNSILSSIFNATSVR